MPFTVGTQNAKNINMVEGNQTINKNRNKSTNNSNNNSNNTRDSNINSNNTTSNSNNTTSNSNNTTSNSNNTTSNSNNSSSNNSNNNNNGIIPKKYKVDVAKVRQEITALNEAKKLQEIKLDGKTYWVTEGDLLLDEEMKSLIESPGGSAGLLAATDSSNNQIVRWSPELVSDIRYFLDLTSFPQKHHDKIKRDLELACGDWESVCGVKFRLVPTSNEALFDVVYDGGFSNGFLALSFFPNWERPSRTIRIFKDAFNCGYDFAGILRHELGHALGFRHEHIRLAGQSSDDDNLNNSFELTAYDCKSVMHYFVAGGGSRDFKISTLDGIGARRIYGSSLSGFHMISK